MLKLQQRFKSKAHNVYNEEMVKIALSSSYGKRLQIFNKITSYPFGANSAKISKVELLEYLYIK